MPMTSTQSMIFERDELIKAIEHIDKHPEISRRRASSTYDLIFENRRYPPILVLSVASRLKGGEELTLKSYNNSIERPFKILRDAGFDVIPKEFNQMTLSEVFKSFKNIYIKERSGKLRSTADSYQLLVKKVPGLIKTRYKLSDNYKVDGSVGKGDFTKYPWVGIFNKIVSRGATNGYYIVLLFSDDLETVFLTLNQGSSVSSKEDKEKITELVFSVLEKVEGFEKGALPPRSLNSQSPARSANLGTAYERTTLFYREYSVEDFNEEDFNEHFISLLGAYEKCVQADPAVKEPMDKIVSEELDISKFIESLTASNLYFDPLLIKRFVASLQAKTFLLLTGLAGSGKTKIAQSFAKWISEDSNQFLIVPVGAEWTNREPLLGYPDGLNPENYVLPDNGALQMIIEAGKAENGTKPYILILDEMNLSHVERYFADFLSIMESGDSIRLYSGAERKANGKVVPQEIHWPANLFIIGTVNIDDTTYMFSPKVLDRANVIEFRLDEDSLRRFFGEESNEPSRLGAEGSSMAKDFLAKAEDQTLYKGEIESEILLFFSQLKKIGAEFGYRTAKEILVLLNQLTKIDPELSEEAKLDVAIMQKLLPKIHGSRSKVTRVLEELMRLCASDELEINNLLREDYTPSLKYPISFEKLLRMYKNAIDNGFASYAEA